MALVKICGLKDAEMAAFAVAEGADWIGLMFAPSPRLVAFTDAPAILKAVGPQRVVAVLQNPSDAELDHVGALGFGTVQLHGEETPQRVREVRQKTGAEVWKVLKIATRIHLAQTRDYAVADGYLLDAAPPKEAAGAGGHGAVFDWSVLAGWTTDKPWLLAGGLNPENVSAALHLTQAPGLDVSSGVERVRGVKNKGLIRDFLRAAKQHQG